MAEVVLSNRMQALTDMVTPGTVITDVGCDHGFVSVYLVQKGISPRVIAMDVRSGPLEHAREHIRECGLEDRIETRLSDGLHSLKTGEAAGMICAGMGGPLMEKILTEGREQAKEFRELILQPQSEIDKVRLYLLTHGYAITGEKMVFEDGKYYPAMRAVHGEMPLWQDVELQYGKYLLEEKHPVLQEYLKEKEKTCKKIQEKLAADGKKAEKITARQKELEDELRLIGQALEVYER